MQVLIFFVILLQRKHFYEEAEKILVATTI